MLVNDESCLMYQYTGLHIIVHVLAYMSDIRVHVCAYMSIVSISVCLITFGGMNQSNVWNLWRILMKIILGKFKVLQRDMRRDEMWRSPSPSRSPGSLPDVRRQRPKVWQGQRRRSRNPGGWLCSLRFGHRDAAVRRDHRWESHGLVSSQIDLIGCS